MKRIIFLSLKEPYFDFSLFLYLSPFKLFQIYSFINSFPKIKNNHTGLVKKSYIAVSFTVSGC